MNASGGIFNNAAQIYNHDFYWDCINPEKTNMSPELESTINQTFNNNFKETFLNSATTVFGSGWCWLAVDENKKLQIIQTSNADTPIKHNKIPILVVDVWEHAYYIDYKNARPKYLEEFYAHINWSFVSEAYKWAIKEGVGSIKCYINDIHKEQA